jgi:hypothetical protein
MENAQPKQYERNKNNILDLYENFDLSESNNEPIRCSNEIHDNNVNKKPLPRSKNDLIFFEETNEKQDVDENLEFLKEMKKNNEDKQVVKRKEEEKEVQIFEENKLEGKEPTENERLIARLRNSGNFHQTEISMLNESKINERKSSSYTKY